MSTTPYKGGRNHKAPYKTSHIRVPGEIKSTLQGFTDIYKVICALKDDDGLQTFKRDLKKFLDCFLVMEAKLYCNAKLVDEETELWIQKEFRRHQEQAYAWEHLHKEELERQKKVKEILTDALSLKANCGGAIKAQIRKAISELD